MADPTIAQWVGENLWAPAVATITTLWTALVGVQSRRMKRIEDQLAEIPSSKEFAARIDADRREHDLIQKNQEAVWAEIAKLREAAVEGFNNLRNAFYDGERRRLEDERARDRELRRRDDHQGRT